VSSLHPQTGPIRSVDARSVNDSFSTPCNGRVEMLAKYRQSPSKPLVILLVLIVTVTLSVVFTACGDSETTSETTQATTPATTGDTTASGDAVVLKFASPDPEVGFASPAQMKWAEELEKRTNGRYRVEFAWSGAMGPFDGHYDLVKNHVADIAFFTVTPPAPLNLAQISSMPWNLPEPEKSLTAFWDLYKQGWFDEEFSEVHPLLVWNGTGSALFSSKPINSVADLKGTKIATSVDYVISFLEQVGSTPVVLLPPEQYGALEKGTVDGTWLVWAAYLPFQFQDVCKYAIEPVFGNMGCCVAMNNDTYDSMPDDVKAIVDQLSEEVLLPETIAGYENSAAAAKDAVTSSGGAIATWPDSDYAIFDEKVGPYWEEWFTKMEADGYSSVREVAKAYYDILKGMGVEKPAFGYSPE
jgi:TRAP-type C4-dicarboxylate transport system substrate-binding protein